MKKMLRIGILILLTGMQLSFAQTLAEKLGYKNTDKLLIVNCDDVGMCHSANVAVMDAMVNGMITSGTIMTPCPWFNEIADFAKSGAKSDLGVHLTHTAEWKHYRWGTVASKNLVSGLLDPQGYMWESVEHVYKHANAEQAYIEGKAQIQKALDAGIDVTHIDSHMGTMQHDPEYYQAYVKLAKEYNLPLRMPSQTTTEKFGMPGLRSQVSSMGLIFPDYFVYEELHNYGEVKPFWTNILKNLKPGVTEIYIHAAVVTDELKAITNSWKTRSQEYETFNQDPDIKKLIEDEGIILIGYRPLRELQRK